MPKKKENNTPVQKNAARLCIEAVLVAILVMLLGYIWLSHEFAGRVPPYVRIGLFPLSGLEMSQVLKSLNQYEQEFAQTNVTVTFRGARSTHTFRELGIELKKEETAEKIRSLAERNIFIHTIQIVPVISLHDDVALKVLQNDFKDRMVIPQSPVLSLDVNRTIQLLPPKNGEHIDMVSLNRDIAQAFTHIPMKEITASAVGAVPEVKTSDIEATRTFAQGLLTSGFHMAAFERTFDISKNVVAGMLRFTSDASPSVQFDQEKLKEYIAEHIVPQIQQDPINARFQVQEGKVSQFALPQDGRVLDMEKTISAVQETLAIRGQTSAIAVRIVHPLIADTGDSEKLGITKLLAVGESDFKGSPKNRTKNIEIGTSKYNGILIAPNEEFSFNAFLGPVNKEAGYLPELVIKNRTTTAEYGGGLCQVSSTVFRAAVNSGMKITNRRNHAYAVRYYGTPGFDATIYPPYTDFRFLNNTPGYILIQTKIDGTKLSFEFWGTDDGRTVLIDGPHPHSRKPDGSVKAVLKQTVTKDGQEFINDTFYSNYKSPNLFPHT